MESTGQNSPSKNNFKLLLDQLLTKADIESSILLSNLTKAIKLSNLDSIETMEFQKQRCLELIVNISQHILKADNQTMSQTLKQLNCGKKFEQMLSSFNNELSKLNPSFVHDLEKKVKTKSDKETVLQAVTALQESLSVISCFGKLFDYLFHDNYKLESTLDLLIESKQLLKIILTIVLNSKLLNSLQNSLKISKIKPSHQSTYISTTFARILFNLLINQNQNLKSQFLQEQGIFILKKIIEASFKEEEMEIYFYALGMIPSLAQMNPPQHQLFKDNNYIGLFIEQFQDIIQNGTYQHLCSPLLLALRALVSKSPSLKQQFILSKNTLEHLVDLSLKCFGHIQHKNLSISLAALMSECGFVTFQGILLDKTSKLQQQFASAQNEGQKVTAKEKLNRLSEWEEQFKKQCEHYATLSEILRSLSQRSMDDEVIQNSLVKLQNLFTQHHITKSFFITTYGNVDLLISSLKNLDENVMQNACKTLLLVLQNEEGAQDLFIRHRGIQILKHCAQDYNIDIKKGSLETLSLLTMARTEAKTEILESGVLEQCLKHVELYPDEDVDMKVLSLSLDIISQAVAKNKQNHSYILEKDGLKKIIVQTKIILDQIQKKPQQLEEQSVLLQKLILSLTNIVYGSKSCQDSIKEMQIFSPLINYLVKGLDLIGESPQYSEEIMCSIITLLVNCIDTNKTNQEFIVNNFKIVDIIQILMRSTKSYRMAGMGALLLSHLTWNNPTAQQVFTLRDVGKRLMILLDFNRLITLVDPNYPVESLLEISFYALLAIVNLSMTNPLFQEIMGQLKVIDVLIKLLKSPSYDPKKTACFALSNLIKDHQENIKQVVELGGVGVLVNLINDEEDDDLSNKSYQCLEYIGTSSIKEILNDLKVILDQRDVKWKQNMTIMIDIFMKRERHIYLKALNPKDKLPSLRDFGPQDSDDMLNQLHQQTLEKLLPVLNGLLYLKKENRELLLSQLDMAKPMFEIFQYQLPIELHENALYSCLNLVMSANKFQKEYLLKLKYLNPICKFIRDLHFLEVNVLKQQNKKFLIIDYGIQINPSLESAHLKDEKTIEEMQPTIFDAKVYEYYNKEDQMQLVDLKSNKKMVIQGEEFEGLGLKKIEVIKHIQELRALGYSILNNLVIGNAIIAKELLKEVMPQLPQLLLSEARIVPDELLLGASFENPTFSESFAEGTLDFLTNLITIEELRPLFIQQGMTLQYLEQLKLLSEEFELGGQDQSVIIGKLTQVINELKQ